MCSDNCWLIYTYCIDYWNEKFRHPIISTHIDFEFFDEQSLRNTKNALLKLHEKVLMYSMFLKEFNTNSIILVDYFFVPKAVLCFRKAYYLQSIERYASLCIFRKLLKSWKVWRWAHNFENHYWISSYRSVQLRLASLQLGTSLI